MKDKGLPTRQALPAQEPQSGMRIA